MLNPVDLSDVAQALCSQQGLTFHGEVGAGAFKKTFRVVTSAGIEKALKVYHPAGVSDRVAREVDAIRRCNHDNIVRFEQIGIFGFNGTDYLLSIEEFIDGGTLDERLSSRGLLDRDTLLRVGAALIDAVSHIESLRLVHRDIKPANVLLRASNGAPVIVDFGLVRDLDQGSLTQTYLARGPGTPLYAAPEQLNNEKAMINWRADQFSLGVMLSFSHYGAHPYAQSATEPHHIVVDKVSSKRGPSANFTAWANAARLPALITMVAPYPVQRFRQPADLITAWTGQV